MCNMTRKKQELKVIENPEELTFFDKIAFSYRHMLNTVNILESCGRINPVNFLIWTCFSGYDPANHSQIEDFSGLTSVCEG